MSKLKAFLTTPVGGINDQSDKVKAAGTPVNLSVDELLLAILEVQRKAFEQLRALRNWVAFGGLLLIVALVLAACNALMR